jgi:uridine kinase
MTTAASAAGLLMGIAGGSGSGKTSVARSIYEDLGPDKVIIIRQDNYYKDLSHVSAEERRTFNFDHPDAFDTPLLLSHVRTLLEGGEVEIPVYDFARHVRTSEVETVGGSKIVILEGIFAFYDHAVRDLMRIKVYIDTDPDVRLIRRLKRDVFERGRSIESILAQYETYVRPMHLRFVEPTKRYADVIIPEGAMNHVAVDLLKTKVRAAFAALR